ncbi:hypothetical protein PHYBOEH_008178 [Phytophthora boehmeriae]|uniref:Uncharacterized protein n=1 Tax=Phytophthora boehmeriae TaxID=109152 RepID=A0A8T1W643_9STRA|nr:hypothetical protein PHYBOEH_008178 [Phytophthora boehmeriae]
MKTSVDSVSVINDNSDGNRFLRITEKAKDAEAKSESEYDSDDDTEDEERGIQDLVRRVSYNTLDDVAGDLAGVPGAAKYLNGQNDELLKTIAARKWTPETMKAELGIAAKNTKRGSTDLGQWKPIAD